jgi:hypothetical protein
MRFMSEKNSLKHFMYIISLVFSLKAKNSKLSQYDGIFKTIQISASTDPTLAVMQETFNT